MILSFLSRWIFRVPFALLFAFGWAYTVPGTSLTVAALGWGVDGLWWAYAVGAFGSFVVAVFWFRLGTWKSGVVDREESTPAPTD